LRNHPSFAADDAAVAISDTGLNKTRFKAPQVADWALVVYVVVYPDEVPGPFNQDINVKSSPSLPLRSARIRERYDRFYIPASTRLQPRGVSPGGNWRKECAMHPPGAEKRRRAEITAKKRLARVVHYRFMGFPIHRVIGFREEKKFSESLVHSNFFCRTKREINTEQIL